MFSASQLRALGFLSLRIAYAAETVAIVFVGLYAVVKGFLMVRSTFLPRALGVISIAGGLGWLLYLYEPLGNHLQAYIVGIGVLGALVDVVWFLRFGVDEQRWNE